MAEFIRRGEDAFKNLVAFEGKYTIKPSGVITKCP
jgi:hypothetical protein